jgi:hypothetical protein
LVVIINIASILQTEIRVDIALTQKFATLMTYSCLESPSFVFLGAWGGGVEKEGRK